MGLLKSPVRKLPTAESDREIASKTGYTSIPKVKLKGGNSIHTQIQNVVGVTSKLLGKYKDSYEIITDENRLEEYIEKCIDNNIYALDTETSSLDPITTTLAGVCLYTPTEKPCYVPINHISYITGMRLNGQLDADVVSSILRKVLDVPCIMHNAKFDIRVCRNQLNIDLVCIWDTMLAAKCIDETESAALKTQYLVHVNDEDGEALNYEKLFENIPFTLIPITTAYLYAAGDPLKTFELYEYQKHILNRRNLPGCFNVFGIEMGVLDVVVDMEEYGVELDLEHTEYLRAKYSKIMEERTQAVYKELEAYKSQIDSFKAANPNHKLSDPVLISSPSQVATLLYDILGISPIDRKSPRGTGIEILSQLTHPIAKLILDYRETAKLMTTYIEKLPNEINEKTGRIHCSFNQYGADTGRFSSSSPNLQNIPAKNHEIRQMFIPGDGRVFISADYSQQEPRLLSNMSMDKNLIDSYKQGKDIYAHVASMVYKMPYEECKEFREDGSVNPEGKKRRQSCKSIILGNHTESPYPFNAESQRCAA